MSNNELIAQIELARTAGTVIKQIRPQKYDPNNFYLTRSDGKQVGPVKVEGSADDLNRKFQEAQTFLATNKSSQSAPRKAA